MSQCPWLMSGGGRMRTGSVSPAQVPFLQFTPQEKVGAKFPTMWSRRENPGDADYSRSLEHHGKITVPGVSD